MAFTKDISNLPKHLFKESLILLQNSNLFLWDQQTIKGLQNGFLSRDFSDKIASLIMSSVAVEYLLKAFLLVNSVDIFKKYENSITDIGDSFSFIALSANSNNDIQRFLLNNNIKMANQLDTKNISPLINLVDQVKMDELERKQLKGSLTKYKDKIRNRFIHLTYGIMQISQKDFDNFYIPAINTQIRMLEKIIKL